MICSDSTIEVTLIQAWRLWFDGCPTGKLILWGHQVFWWGRLGKVIELVSALLIVTEVIGPNKLNALGRMLRVQFGLKFFRFLFRNIVLSIKTILGYQKGSGELSPRAALFVKEVRIPVLVITFLSMLFTDGNVAIVLLLICLFLLAYIIHGLIKEGEYILALYFDAAVAGLTVSLPILILIAIAELFLFRPIAWILEGRSRDKLIKLASILLLLLGFHFDLLSS